MDTVDWNEVERVRRAVGLTHPEDQAATRKPPGGARTWPLVDLRRGRHKTQSEVACAMDVSGVRVSAIENGDIDRTEVAALRSYVEALGGRLRVVADFEDTSLTVV